MRRLLALGLCGGWLSVSLLAQSRPPTAPHPPASTPQSGPEHAASMLRLSRLADSNGDLLVEEKELNEGFQKLQREAEKARADLLTWLDVDKNGKLSPEELRPFHAAVQALQLIRAVDQNGDLQLQDDELDTAFSQMADHCQVANDHLLAQFDRDGDGKFSETELQVARRGLGGQGLVPTPGTRSGPARNAAVSGRRKAAP